MQQVAALTLYEQLYWKRSTSAACLATCQCEQTLTQDTPMLQPSYQGMTFIPPVFPTNLPSSTPQFEIISMKSAYHICWWEISRRIIEVLTKHIGTLHLFNAVFSNFTLYNGAQLAWHLDIILLLCLVKFSVDSMQSTILPSPSHHPCKMISDAVWIL